MLRTDIGEGDAALQCTTDSITCCTNGSPAGEYYFPNGDIVMIHNASTNGYYISRSSRHIRLNRQTTGTITGQFGCEIPNASGTVVNLLVNIGELVCMPVCHTELGRGAVTCYNDYCQCSIP